MPKWSSYVTRFLLLLVLGILVITVANYGLSNYLFEEISNAGHYTSLNEGLTQAEKLYAGYRTGQISPEQLQAQLNPAMNPDGYFYMALDEDSNILGMTEDAASYFSGDTLPTLITALKREGTAIVRNRFSGTLALIVGHRVEGGYLLAGMTMRTYNVSSANFRTRLMLIMCIVALCILFFSTFAAQRVSKPAMLITQTASRLLEGEQVILTEDLPGREMQEIARAFNHMSKSVATAIRDLKYEKQTLTLILEALSEGVIALTEDGKLLHCNTAARELLGENTPQWDAVIRAMHMDTDADTVTGRVLRGESILFYAVNRLPQEDGVRTGTVALIRDITQQELLERTRHDYVANISHELRTPLASMRGLAEGLRDGMVEEADRQRYYNIIVNEVTRLSRLVNDLLELSSLQANPSAFETEKVDPNEMLYDLTDRNMGLFNEKQLDLILDMPEEELPVIISNEDRLSQVLTIFLDNARKYTNAGGNVTIGARKLEDGIRFYVRDTGIGMDEETQRLAFERFHQAERGRSDKGSGLGLSIAREVLQKMNISISLRSEPGNGSEFSFVVPFEQQENGLVENSKL